MVAWTSAELSNPALVLEVGDTVEFAAVVDKPTKRVRADKVRGMRRQDVEGNREERKRRSKCVEAGDLAVLSTCLQLRAVP